MSDNSTDTKAAIVNAERARAEARKQADKAKFIIARIRAAKAKRMANRPKPEVKVD